jgi:Spy/CpxP family protein refolding chaperone
MRERWFDCRRTTMVLAAALILGIAAVTYAADTEPALPPEPAIRIPQTQTAE